MSEEKVEDVSAGKKPPTFTWEEVAKHNTAESLWMVVHDKVYDVTPFMDEVRWGYWVCGALGEGSGRVLVPFMDEVRWGYWVCGALGEEPVGGGTGYVVPFSLAGGDAGYMWSPKTR